MSETYHGPIDVSFDGMPSIRLESFQFASSVGALQRLAAATRRRRFSLKEDWQIELEDIDYSADLNGTIEIPAKDSSDKSIVFDGASIPFPWLVSLLSIGILRPLGVILIGSIVHDYAYQYGMLRISKSGNEFREVPLSRDRADRLFRDIVGTINQVPLVGYIAWFAVRLGWIGVKYNGKRFGGKPPVMEYIAAAILLFIVWQCVASLGAVKALCIFVFIYFLLYALSLFFVKPRNNNELIY